MTHQAPNPGPPNPTTLHAQSLTNLRLAPHFHWPPAPGPRLPLPLIINKNDDNGDDTKLFSRAAISIYTTGDFQVFVFLAQASLLSSREGVSQPRPAAACYCKSSFPGTQPHPFIYTLSTGCFCYNGS